MTENRLMSAAPEPGACTFNSGDLGGGSQIVECLHKTALMATRTERGDKSMFASRATYRWLGNRVVGLIFEA